MIVEIDNRSTEYVHIKINDNGYNVKEAIIISFTQLVLKRITPAKKPEEERVIYVDSDLVMVANDKAYIHIR